jgi:hypothetical protein
VFDQECLPVNIDRNGPCGFLGLSEIREAQEINEEEVDEVIRWQAIACLHPCSGEEEVSFGLGLVVSRTNVAESPPCGSADRFEFRGNCDLLTLKTTPH